MLLRGRFDEGFSKVVKSEHYTVCRVSRRCIENYLAIHFNPSFQNFLDGESMFAGSEWYVLSLFSCEIRILTIEIMS